MWLLQQINQPEHKSARLFLVLISCSVLFHVGVIVFWLFSSNKPMQCLFVNTTHEIPIYFAPLQKHIPGALQALQQKNPVSSSVSKQQPNKQQLKKIVQTKTVKKDVPQKTASKQSTVPTTAKKPIVKKSVDKPKPIPQEAPKKEVKQPEVAKVREKLSEPSEQKVSVPETQEIKDTISPQEVQNNTITLGSHDVDTILLVKELEQSLSAVWQGPSVHPAGLRCRFMVAIDDHGNAVDIVQEQPSMSLAYNCAARAALQKISFPKQLWSSKQRIEF